MEGTNDSEKAVNAARQESGGNDDESWDEKEEERYCDDAAYRLECGPSIERWGDYGLDESLVGLKITCFDFGPSFGGKCEGTVRSIKESNRDYEHSEFNVVWTCEETKEEFPSHLMATDVVAWHFYGRQKPSWMNDEKYDCGLNCAALLSVKDTTATTMKNFHLPCLAEEIFPLDENERDNRWEVTLCCLNDPECAHVYDPTGKMAYPLSLLLAIIVISKREDPSVKLPVIVSSDNKEMFERADIFARRLSQSGHRTGYKELEALEDIVDEIVSDINVSYTDNKWRDNDSWKSSYEQCEALILTLSRDFENDNDSWYYANAPERIDNLCAKLILALGIVLLHVPSKEMKDLLHKDLAFFSQHVQAGNFVQFVEEEDFSEYHSEAFATWGKLTQLWTCDNEDAEKEEMSNV